nr:helix-turn-helix domain-containing protein [uncultured Carboxylicivirga sp.]
MNKDQIVTTEHLQQFKSELLSEIKTIINTGESKKQWLKSKDVIKQLKISPGTLQNMRVNGIIPFTRIGGVIYYDQDDIQQMLIQNKQT